MSVCEDPHKLFDLRPWYLAWRLTLMPARMGWVKVIGQTSMSNIKIEFFRRSQVKVKFEGHRSKSSRSMSLSWTRSEKRVTKVKVKGQGHQEQGQSWSFLPHQLARSLTCRRFHWVPDFFIYHSQTPPCHRTNELDSFHIALYSVN